MTATDNHSSLRQITIATNDGVRIADHFRSSLYFEQIRLAGSYIQSRDRIDKSGIDGFHVSIPPLQTGEPADHHQAMTHALNGTHVVITRGIGHRMFNLLTQKGIQVIVTRERFIDDALRLLIQDQLLHFSDRIH